MNPQFPVWLSSPILHRMKGPPFVDQIFSRLISRVYRRRLCWWSDSCIDWLDKVQGAWPRVKSCKASRIQFCTCTICIPKQPANSLPLSSSRRMSHLVWTAFSPMEEVALPVCHGSWLTQHIHILTHRPADRCYIIQVVLGRAWGGSFRKQKTINRMRIRPQLVRCGVVRCDAMRCDVMWCRVTSCHVMSCDPMSCHVMWCDVMRLWCGCDAMWLCDVVIWRMTCSKLRRARVAVLWLHTSKYCSVLQSMTNYQTITKYYPELPRTNRYYKELPNPTKYRSPVQNTTPSTKHDKVLQSSTTPHSVPQSTTPYYKILPM